MVGGVVVGVGERGGYWFGSLAKNTLSNPTDSTGHKRFALMTEFPETSEAAAAVGADAPFLWSLEKEKQETSIPERIPPGCYSSSIHL